MLWLEERRATYVREPIEDGGNGVGVDTSAQVGELGGQEPSHAKPSDTEEAVEGEKEDDSGNTVSVFEYRCAGLWVNDASGHCTCKDGHGDGHADGTEEHEGAATKAVNGRDGEKRCQEIFSSTACRNQTRELGVEAKRVLEDVGGIVGLNIISAVRFAKLVVSNLRPG